MTPGRLIAVVGPSGVGKDSLIDALVAARPRLYRVRRVITRAPDAGGEPFDAVSPEEFARRRAAGAFVLSWQAHGLHYAVPAATLEVLKAGDDALANLSRAVLAEAQTVFPRLHVLAVTAAPAAWTGQRRRCPPMCRRPRSTMAARWPRPSPPRWPRSTPTGAHDEAGGNTRHGPRPAVPDCR